ncbi:type 1 glutamine amidotransferase domain-containing protein [Thiobacillus sedimenti]|uniref:Type 1 glutamine amidotransferase domain-containing protein n=1 Tax=Thiobacillus sedimenti TaxID=3110231 RepID=A0ABZ1CM14_9PROT|nr:type 1 glutamine amidotransferase domain-containing protein [Thiobacillus sp. SCUT-2]WRS40425.1 type 1 glutamine amidotransferase domain-containing protein [Thiobacillus sp. SCUT-2]
MKALIVSADRFEDTELLVPLYRLQEEGLQVDVASISRGAIHGKHGYEVDANIALRDVSPGDYALLVLPGGQAPATLRKEPAAIAVARAFMDANKPVAAICHGPQILITAGVMRGRRATCFHTVAGELQTAGAHYADLPVVVDGRLVTSRQPSDLPAFMRELMDQLKSIR